MSSKGENKTQQKQHQSHLTGSLVETNVIPNVVCGWFEISSPVGSFGMFIEPTQQKWKSVSFSVHLIIMINA